MNLRFRSIDSESGFDQEEFEEGVGSWYGSLYFLNNDHDGEVGKSMLLIDDENQDLDDVKDGFIVYKSEREKEECFDDKFFINDQPSTNDSGQKIKDRHYNDPQGQDEIFSDKKNFKNARIVEEDCLDDEKPPQKKRIIGE